MRRILLLALGAFALGLDAYVMAGLLPVVAGDLHVSASAAGQMVTVFTLCYALAAPVFATVLAGRPARVILSLALLVFTLANALSALATSLIVLLIARAVAGIGAGVYSPLAAATAASLSPPERRGRGLAIVMGGMSVGTVVGVPVGVVLAHHISWRGTLWLVTALGFIALLGAATLLPKLPASPPPAFKERIGVLANRRVAPIALVSFLAGVASLGLYTYLASFLSDSAGLSDPTGYLWAWGIGGVVGSLCVGPLVDRTKKAYGIATVLFVLLAVSQVALPGVASTRWGLILPLIVWGAAGWALQVPQQHELIAAEPEHSSVAVSLNSSAVYLGSATGSALGGLVLASGVSPSGLPYCTAPVAFAALVLHLTLVRWGRKRPAPSVGAAPVADGGVKVSA
ncbi:MFS transporter [Streptomyces sp. NPDC101393]|uniref:MFS transporter n=1 Tax=Streptomyces sp. NPDC101393 TaxID=3366141 RepID=UPI003829B927